MFLLSRNRVKDFATWKKVFDANTEAGLEAGMKVINMWRAVGDPNNVFFMFEVASKERAEAFMAAPEAAEAGRVSGVVDGEYYFLDEVD